MFHVKPRVTISFPETIAKGVRARVEEVLAELAFAPPQPDFAARIERLAAEIALWGARVNLTAEPENPSEIAFHVLDSLMPIVLGARPEGAPIRGAFRVGRLVLDLGSGAGFPALVLAAASQARFTLLEARRKRASFLAVTAAAMDLRNVTVEPERGDPAKFNPVFDVVTGRAFGRLAEFYRGAAAALSGGGLAILYANPGQRLELDAARSSGLGDLVRIEYPVRRGDRTVARMLAIWRRL
jgi:16S rRNA (guanine527-N7)-methyltransferase